MPLNSAHCKNQSRDAHPDRAWPVTKELKTASVMGKSLLFIKPNMVLKKAEDRFENIKNYTLKCRIFLLFKRLIVGIYVRISEQELWY